MQLCNREAIKFKLNMEDLTIINHFRYGPFTTQVKASKLVLDFVGEEINLTKDIDVDKWYRGWLLELDDDKDGAVDSKYGTEFELIYCWIIENPEDFLEKDAIAEELGIKEEEIISDGSFEINKNIVNNTKFWIRWIIKKK
jgi:hypothetical protein